MSQKLFGSSPTVCPKMRKNAQKPNEQSVFDLNVHIEVSKPSSQDEQTRSRSRTI